MVHVDSEDLVLMLSSMPSALTLFFFFFPLVFQRSEGRNLMESFHLELRTVSPL